MRSPQANVRPISPLLQPQPLCLRISHPSDISALRRLLITVYQKSGKRLPFGAYFEKNPPERHKKYSALGRKYANIKIPDTKTIRCRKESVGRWCEYFQLLFRGFIFFNEFRRRNSHILFKLAAEKIHIAVTAYLGNPDNFKPRMVCLSAVGFEKQQGKPDKLCILPDEKLNWIKQSSLLGRKYANIKTPDTKTVRRWKETVER